MNAIFGSLTTEGLEQTEDRLGGFTVLESGLYTGTIKAAYAGNSATSKARKISLILELENGREYREDFWITNKEDKNWYADSRDPSKRRPLMGFTHMDDICLVTTDQPLSNQPTEEKVMNIYDPEAKKELPKSVPMLVNLLGKKVTLGIVKEIVSKTVKDASGNYVPTDESREQNVTDKVFHPTLGITVVEARQGVKEPVFRDAWLKRNEGRDRDRRSKTAANQNGQAGVPPAAAATIKTASLFNS